MFVNDDSQIWHHMYFTSKLINSRFFNDPQIFFSICSPNNSVNLQIALDEYNENKFDYDY